MYIQIYIMNKEENIIRFESTIAMSKNFDWVKIYIYVYLMVSQHVAKQNI